jgi:hypothetical protein
MWILGRVIRGERGKLIFEYIWACENKNKSLICRVLCDYLISHQIKQKLKTKLGLQFIFTFVIEAACAKFSPKGGA